MKSVWCDCNDDVILTVALYKNKLGLVKVLSDKGEGQMSFKIVKVRKLNTVGG